MELKTIVNEIRNYPGITRKRGLHQVVEILKSTGGDDTSSVVTDFGEDAAAITYGDHYLLLAAEGMWPQFVKAEPYAAGKAAVMASVNDIYAMGGTPLALVNVLSASKDTEYRLMMEGIRKGCEKFGVPMVGGHFNPDAGEPSLAVSILGVARKLLRSTNARAGQKIVLAADLQGTDGRCRSVLSWDANSGKSTAYVRERLEIVRYLAEEGLCETAKDVSNGGMVGTVSLLCEYSRKGCVIVLDEIPTPAGVELIKWLKAFLSYGFILCVDDARLAACLDVFQKKDIAARVIGEVTEKREVVLQLNHTQEVVYNFRVEQITGI